MCGYCCGSTPVEKRGEGHKGCSAECYNAPRKRSTRPAPAPAAGTGDGTEVIEAVLAAHRQEHRPLSGDSMCACGRWVGPFTMHTGTGSYSSHLATAIRAALTPPEDQP